MRFSRCAEYYCSSVKYDSKIIFSPSNFVKIICQLLRSDYSKQRILATCMLTGILLRIDHLTSLTCSEDYSKQENCYLDPLKIADLQNDPTYRLPFSQYRAFSRSFHQICSAYSSDAREGEVLNRREVLDLFYRVSSQVFGASLLPSNLPTLLLLSLRRANSGATSNSQLQHLLQCLKTFLSSILDESHSSLLWLGLWGLGGSPPLPMPHTIRSISLSYEQQIQQCKMKKCSFLHQADEEVDEEGEELTVSRATPDPSDVFALQCRWGRIDAIFQLVGEFDLLASVLLPSIMTSIQCMSGAFRTLLKNKNEIGSLDHWNLVGDEKLVILNGITALELLAIALRGGDSETVQLIDRKVAQKARLGFLSLTEQLLVFCNATAEKDEKLMIEEKHSEMFLLLSAYLSAWWRFGAEFLRRSRTKDSKAFNLHGATGDAAKPSVLSRFMTYRIEEFFSPLASTNTKCPIRANESLWIFRLLRVSMAREGMQAAAVISQLLQAGDSNQQNLIGKLVELLEDRNDPVEQELLVATEFVWLLEQGAVLISDFFKSFDSTSISVRIEQDDKMSFEESLAVHLMDISKQLLRALASSTESASPAKCLFQAAVCHFICALFQESNKGEESTGIVRPNEITRRATTASKSLMVRSGHLVEALTKSSSYDMHFTVADKIAELESTVELSWDALLSRLRSFSDGEGCEFQSISRWAKLELQSAATVLFALLSEGDEKVDARFFERVLGRQQSKSVAVSDGLLCWQEQRLKLAVSMAKIRFLSVRMNSPQNDANQIALTSLREAIEDCMYSFSSGPITAYFLWIYLELTVTEEITSDAERWTQFKIMLVTTIFQISKRTENDLTSAHDSAQFEQFLYEPIKVLNGTGERMHLPSTLLDCTHSQGQDSAYIFDDTNTFSSLQSSFLFRLLMKKDVSGESLQLLLKLLLDLQLQNVSIRTRESQEKAKIICEKVFFLMSLTLVEQTDRWYDPVTSFGGYPVVMELAVTTFVRLFVAVMKEAQEFYESIAGSGCTTLRSAFLSVCGKEYLSMRNFFNREKNQSLEQAGNIGKDLRKDLKGESNAYEFCCQAITSAVNQSIAPEVHSAVLCYLALTSNSFLFPFRARQRLWKELRDMRLVHLMDLDEVVRISSVDGKFPLKFFVPSGKEEDDANLLGAARDIVKALATLRTQENLLAVKVVCFQLSVMITPIRHGNLSTIAGEQVKLLLSMIVPRATDSACPPFVLGKVISMILFRLNSISNSLSDPSLDDWLRGEGTRRVELIQTIYPLTTILVDTANHLQLSQRESCCSLQDLLMEFCPEIEVEM